MKVELTGIQIKYIMKLISDDISLDEGKSCYLAMELRDYLHSLVMEK